MRDPLTTGPLTTGPLTTGPLTTGPLTLPSPPPGARDISESALSLLGGRG